MVNGITTGQSPLYYNQYDKALYGAQSAQRIPSHARSLPAAQPETPVQPVTPAPVVQSAPLDKTNLLSRYESDPTAMAVRGRIQYAGEGAATQVGQPPVEMGAKAGQAGPPPAAMGAAGHPAAMPGAPGKAGEAGQPGASENTGAAGEAQSAQEVMEEAECQTCAERKYQDGSDDPGVSFKTAGHIDPDNAAAVVRGHEQEHVVRNQVKAEQEDRKVVSQSVTLHSAICPECGRAYISGGTTCTVTKADLDAPVAEEQQGQQVNAAKTPFSAVA